MVMRNVANVAFEVAEVSLDERKRVTTIGLEGLRAARAPGYVSNMLAHGDALEKLALRDTRDDS
jgi:hypothetical protein